MKTYNEKNPDKREKAKRPGQLALIVLVLAAAVVVTLTQFGAVAPVQAQVNLGRVGETVTDTVGEAASETAGRYAEAEQEIENPTPVEAGGDMGTEALEPAEVVEVAPEEEISEEMAQVITEQYYTSSEGISGKKFVELTDDEIRANLDEIVTALSGSSNEIYVNALLPIFQRFQVMVSPPVDQVEDFEQPPWESGERRYSPFDPPGIAGPGPGFGIEPVPPFTREEPYGPGGQTGPELVIDAEMIAQLTRLKGVLSEGDSYVAILTIQGVEQRVRVGDYLMYSPGQVLVIGEDKYVVTEISMNSVKIQTENDTSDTGIIYFGARTQIQNFSISY